MVKKTVKLSDNAVEYITRPVNGSGGFQSLLRKLFNQYEPFTNTVVVSSIDRLRIRKYALEYNNGGFETRLRRLFPDLLESE